MDVDRPRGGYAAADDIVKGAALSADAGEIVTLIGPNGAGKSTALKLIAGLLPPSQGSVRFEQHESRVSRRRTSGGPRLRAAGAQCLRHDDDRRKPRDGRLFERSAARKRMDELYERFPMLADKRRAAARTLVGGQRQILAMAIALMQRPGPLLLDEPTAGLSPRAAEELFGIIRVSPTKGIAILMVEQNALGGPGGLRARLCAGRGRDHLDGPADPRRRSDIRDLFLGGRATKRLGWTAGQSPASLNRTVS